MPLGKKQQSAGDAVELRMAAGRWLRAARQTRGLSQRQLAAALDLEYYTFVSQLENGRGRVPPGRYLDWADALDVDRQVFVKKLLSFYDPISYSVLFDDEGNAR